MKSWEMLEAAWKAVKGYSSDDGSPDIEAAVLKLTEYAMFREAQDISRHPWEQNGRPYRKQKRRTAQSIVELVQQEFYSRLGQKKISPEDLEFLKKMGFVKEYETKD